LLLIARDKAKKGLGYLALARVNRQIRAEYRPFLFSRIRLAVGAEQLDDFIDTFYPNAKQPGGDLEEYEGGNIVVIVIWETATFDLMRLVRLCENGEFTVTINPVDMCIWECQYYYIFDLNRLMTDLIKRTKIAEDSDEEETEISENDAIQANKAWERR
jgi:hypothetical protein